MKCGAAWGLVKAHFQLPILAAHTHKHKAARPQAYKKIGGRKAASARALIAGWPRALEDAWQIVKKIPGYDKANTFIYMRAWYN